MSNGVVTLMMLDTNRYFQAGLLHYLRTLFPHAFLVRNASAMPEIDVMIAACDAVSMCSAQHYLPRLTPASQLVMVHDGSLPDRGRPPPALVGRDYWQLPRQHSLLQLRALLCRILPSGMRRLAIVDRFSLPRARLTPREETLIAHLGRQATPRQIAVSMSLHEKTVSSYKRSVMSKLGMETNLELYHWLLYQNMAQGKENET